MGRNKRVKKQYRVCINAIIIYFIIVIISILICFIAKAKDYIYILVMLGVSIAYLFLFISAFYESLNKINNDDIEEIKMKYINTSFERTLLNFKNNNNYEMYNDIFIKSFKDKKSNFKRYVYVSNLDRFDIALEEFLHKSKNLLDNNGKFYFELFIVLFPKRNDDYSTEPHKEINANYYNFPNNIIPLHDKLFKCLIFDPKQNILYYNKNNVHDGSIDALDFIENDLIKNFYE